MDIHAYVHANTCVYFNIHKYAYTYGVPYTIRVFVLLNGTACTVSTSSQSLWPMSTAEKRWRGASTSRMGSSLSRTEWNSSVLR